MVMCLNGTYQLVTCHLSHVTPLVMCHLWTCHHSALGMRMQLAASSFLLSSSLFFFLLLLHTFFLTLIFAMKLRHSLTLSLPFLARLAPAILS